MPRNNYTSYVKRLGIEYPFNINSSGNLESFEETREVVRQNLYLFFKTEKGSRIMRPNLGIKLRHRLGEPLVEELRDNLADAIREQLNNQFPKVNVLNVELEQPNELTFLVIIKYKIKHKVNQSVADEIKIKIQ